MSLALLIKKRRMRKVMRALLADKGEPGISGATIMDRAELWFLPYPEVWTLEEAGYVSRDWEPLKPGRKYRTPLYRLTDEGRERIAAMLEEWDK